MRFTRDNAREYSAKGNAARWSPENRAAQPPAEPAPTPAIIPEPPRDPTYSERRKARVRKQLDTLDAEIEREMGRTNRNPDAKRIKELVDAQMRLSEQERILSGRPLPGSNRPRSERPRRSQSSVEPLETPQAVGEQPPNQPPA